VSELPRTARAATLVAPSRIEIREYPVPEVAEDGALLEVELGGVCGTDVKYFRGRIPTPMPLILGHEILGRIVRIGPVAAQIHGVREGDRVILKGSRGCGNCRACRRGAPRFCPTRTGYGFSTSSTDPPHLFGGFADYLYVAPDAQLTAITEDLPGQAAVLIASVMANGYQWAVHHGGVTIGSYVLIQGPGQQGLACTWAAAQAGAARIVVTGLGRDADRLALARKWGAHRTVDVEQEDPVEVVRAETGGDMAAIATSIECVRTQGTLVLAGLTGAETSTSLRLDPVVMRELTVQGAFTADHVALAATLGLLESTGFPVQEMVSHEFPLDETARCIEAVAGDLPGMLPTKAVIRPGNPGKRQD
jgi:alcohol dehydrogenase